MCNIVSNNMTKDLTTTTEQEWKNLAPNIVRQRLIIEGTTIEIVPPLAIEAYLKKLADITKMEILGGPFTRSAHELGYAGWVHWRTSGGHFYSYPPNAFGQCNDALFTVDTYTCKPFSVSEAVDFTRQYFNPLEMVWKEVKV